MDLQRAKELLSSLANGIDPFNGEPLPEDSVCNKTEIVRAIHCVLRELTAKQSKPAKPRLKTRENRGRRKRSGCLPKCTMPEARAEKCVTALSAHRPALHPALCALAKSAIGMNFMREDDGCLPKGAFFNAPFGNKSR